MNVALRRRSTDCVSDLTIDRWLLGETPGSDEARELEAHMKVCAVCAARLGSLRSLYANQPTDDVATTAVVMTEPPRQTPTESGVVQIIVLRDGLLVGTEYFTTGRWSIGSGATDLTLSDGPAAKHAVLHFHDGAVAIESHQGPVYVNGVRLQRALVRPVDEVWIGPYALRTRVITERWSWPTMISAPPATAIDPTRASPTRAAPGLSNPTQSAPGLSNPTHSAPGLSNPTHSAPGLSDTATVVERPATTRTALHATLWWGDRLLGETAFSTPVDGQPLRALGFERMVKARRLADGRWQLEAPTSLTLSLHEASSVNDGALRLVLSVRPLAATLPRAKMLDVRFTAIMVTAFVLFFTAVSVAPERSDEADFSPRVIPPIHVSITPPAPKVKPTPSAAPDPTTPPAVAHQATKSNRRASPPPPRNRFEAIDRLTSSAAKIATALGRTGLAPTKTKRTYGAALPGVGLPLAPSFGIGSSEPAVGIGRAGLKTAGAMHSGGYGREGKVGGVTVGPVRSGQLASNRTSPGVVDKDAVAKVIAQHLGEVQRCYEASLLTESSDGGRLALEWTIGLTGSVTQARVVSSTLRQVSVPQCVLKALRGWPFPKPRGGQVVVSYPFVFQSSTYR